MIKKVVNIIGKKVAWIYIVVLSLASFLFFWILAYLVEHIGFCIPYLFCVYPFWHIFRSLAIISPLIVTLYFALDYEPKMVVPKQESYILGEKKAKVFILSNGKGVSNEKVGRSFFTRL